MTYDELIKLVNAGFSKEDIQKLTAETKVSKNDEPVVQDPEKSAVESETKVSEEKEEMNDYFSKLNTAMNDFIERLQKMNVMTADSESKPTNERTAYDIVSDILGGK